MQTNLADFIRDTPEGKEAEAILRKCVHCGFCTATCPTYQILGDELDGPRGRIYLIKHALEGAPVTGSTRFTSIAASPAAPARPPVRRACSTAGLPTSAAPSSRRAPSGRCMTGGRAACLPRFCRAARCSVPCSRSGGWCGRCCPRSCEARSCRAARARAASGRRRGTHARCSSSRAACSRCSRRRSTPQRHACSTASASRSWRRPAQAAAERCASTSTSRTTGAMTCAASSTRGGPSSSAARSRRSCSRQAAAVPR